MELFRQKRSLWRCTFIIDKTLLLLPRQLVRLPYSRASASMWGNFSKVLARAKRSPATDSITAPSKLETCKKKHGLEHTHVRVMRLKIYRDRGISPQRLLGIKGLTLWLPRAPNGALKMPGLISHVVPRSTQRPQRLYPVYFAHVLTSVLIYIL